MTCTPNQLFLALSHETRLRCIVLLARHEELCVCELTHALGASQPHVSHHLAHLRDAGIISDRRAGLWVHYRVHTALAGWACRVLEETVAGLADTAPFDADERALAAMPDRPGLTRCA